MFQISSQVAGDKMKFFMDIEGCTEGREYICTIPLSDSAEIVAEKTKAMINVIMTKFGLVKPQYLIHDLVDSKGQLKDCRLVRRTDGWRWRWVDGKGQVHHNRYNPTTRGADQQRFMLLLADRYNLPQDSITYMVVRGLLDSMVRQTY